MFNNYFQSILENMNIRFAFLYILLSLSACASNDTNKVKPLTKEKLGGFDNLETIDGKPIPVTVGKDGVLRIDLTNVDLNGDGIADEKDDDSLIKAAKKAAKKAGLEIKEKQEK